jgi:ribosome-binding factor A
VTRRTDRIDDLIRAELAQLLLRDVNDPRVRLATISEVTVSKDLRHAKVKVSVLGDDAHRSEAIAGLTHARGFLRSQLSHRLRLRVVPELDFELDRGAEYSQQISDLLDDLHDRNDGE